MCLLGRTNVCITQGQHVRVFNVVPVVFPAWCPTLDPTCSARSRCEACACLTKSIRYRLLESGRGLSKGPGSRTSCRQWCIDRLRHWCGNSSYLHTARRAFEHISGLCHDRTSHPRTYLRIFRRMASAKFISECNLACSGTTSFVLHSLGRNIPADRAHQVVSRFTDNCHSSLGITGMDSWRPYRTQAMFRS